MDLNLPIYVLYALHIFTACALFLDFATDCYYLDKSPGSWKIHAGYGPGDRNVAMNVGFYLGISVVAWLVLSILLGVVEVCLVFKVAFVEQFRTGLIRPIVYLMMGIAHLGICNDLGIAAGSLTIIAGACWLIIAICAMI